MSDPMSDPVMRRKVMPIYSALDSQQNKQAVKLCSKKDVASVPLVKSLKAVALSRLDQLPEAQALCNEVIATSPIDDTLLNTLRLTLRTIGDFNGILDMYEQALALQPKNYLLAKEVLSACVGVGDFVKFQMLCLKFARQFAHLDFALWAAASIVLQSDNNQEGPDEAAAIARRLQLGRGIIGKLRKDNASAFALAQPGDRRKEWAEELALHIELRLNDYEAALVLIGSDSDEIATTGATSAGGVTSDAVAVTVNASTEEKTKEAGPEVFLAAYTQRLLRRGELLILAGKYSAAEIVLFNIISELDPDNWRSYELWLQACTSKDEEGDAPLKNEEDILRSLSELQIRYLNKRAPQLALVAYTHAQFEAANADERMQLGSALLSSICSYVDRFGTKQCCFDDLRNFLLVFIPIHMRPEAPTSLTQDEKDFRPRREASAQRPLGLGTPIAMEIDRVTRVRRWPLDLIGQLGVQDDQRSELIGWLRERASDSFNSKNKDADVSEQKKQLRMLSTCFQTLKFIGVFKEMSIEDTMSEVRVLFQEFEDTKTMIDGGSEANDLVLLMAHMITDLGEAYEHEPSRVSSTSKKSNMQVAKRLYLEAIALVEYVSLEAEFSFQLCMMLMELYGRLDAFVPLCVQYNKLGVKYIQNDTLSYLALNDAIALGFASEAQACCGGLTQFWYTVRRDTQKFIESGLDNGNFAKVFEFNRLRQRIEFSQQVAVAQCELLFTQFPLENAEGDLAKAREILQAALVEVTDGPIGLTVSHPESRISSAASLPSERLCMNSDFEVRNSWDTPSMCTTPSTPSALGLSTPSRQSSSLTATSHALRAKTAEWIDVRVSLARALHACFAEEGDDGTEMDGYVKQLQHSLESLQMVGASTSSLDEQLWSAVLVALQVGQQLRVMKFGDAGSDAKKKVDEATAKASTTARVTAAGLADDATAKLTQISQDLAKLLGISRGETTGSSLPLRSLGFAAINQVNWLVLLVHWWDSQFSKWSKKKLEVADTTNPVTKLRVAAKGTATALQVLLSVINDCTGAGSEGAVQSSADGLPDGLLMLTQEHADKFEGQVLPNIIAQVVGSHRESLDRIRLHTPTTVSLKRLL